MSEKDQLEARVRNIEAVHDIINLETDYCFAVDILDGDAFAATFVTDGVLEIEAMGRSVGRDAIRSMCVDQFSKGFSSAMHFLHNPRIVVDGDTATGKYYWHASLTSPDSGAVKSASGKYDCKYVKTDEGWKIMEKKVKFVY